MSHAPQTAAWIFYTCRLCGITFPACHVPDGPTALAIIEQGAPQPSTWRGKLPGQLILHHECEQEGRGQGVADLAGWRAEEEEESSP